MSVSAIKWIGVDWGTSNLRAWGFDQADRPVFSLSSDKGMNSLTPAEFEPALLELIGNRLSDNLVTPVLCCGMVGAKQGWVEAPYSETPCYPADTTRAVRVETNDPRMSVKILPGVCQHEPADVMRGEETQIAGFLADNPDFEGTVCLPGTHTKWASVSDGRIRNFATVMTGEVFALLSEQSVLRHSLAGEGSDMKIFIRSVLEAVDAPQALTANLFPIRAASLLRSVTADESRARLSGLLIGQELAAIEAYWKDRPVVLISADRLNELYTAALITMGITARAIRGDDLSVKGLKAARGQLEKDGR